MKKVLYLFVTLLMYLPLQYIHASGDLAGKKQVKVSLTTNAPSDLRLMIKSALEKHPRILAARAALQASIKRLKAARQAVYNPELELDTERTDINSSFLQLSQTIDMGDQRGSLTNVAQAALIKAKADYELAVLQLQNDLVSAYIKYDTQLALSRLSGDVLKLMTEFMNIAELRNKAGDLNQVELDLAHLAHSEAVLNHAKVLSEVIFAREKLNAIFITLPTTVPALHAELPQARLPGDIGKFMRTLPVVRSRKAEINIARNTVNLRRSEKRINPTVALRGGRDGSKSMVGLSLSIPLYVRNNYSAEIEVAQQKLIESKQLGHQAFRDQRARILASTQRLKILSRAWLIWKKTGQSSISRQLESIKRLWRAGDINTSDYLVQLKQTLDTQVAGIELKNKLWNSTLEWLLVTASIDDWLNLTTELN